LARQAISNGLSNTPTPNNPSARLVLYPKTFLPFFFITTVARWSNWEDFKLLAATCHEFDDEGKKLNLQ